MRESKGKQQQGDKGVKDRVGPQQEKVTKQSVSQIRKTVFVSYESGSSLKSEYGSDFESSLGLLANKF